MKHYILEGKIPVPEPDLILWGEWYQSANREVASTNIGKARISTVFMGIDHTILPNKKSTPILFETMVFGGKLDGAYDRCGTWEEAEAMHKKMCKKVKEKNHE